MAMTGLAPVASAEPLWTVEAAEIAYLVYGEPGRPVLSISCGQEEGETGRDETRIQVEVEKGDMVCIYTGFADVLLEMKKKPDPRLVNETCSGLDGRDQKLLQWITDSGLACILADNYAVELIQGSLTDPLPRKQPWLPLHEHCLFKNGIHLGEMFYFTELARWLRAHRRSRFLFTAPPLRLPGAVGSPATPIATV